MNFDKKDDNAVKDSTSDIPTSLADELHKEEVPESKPFYKALPFIIGMGVLGALLIVGIVFSMLLGGSDDESNQQAIAQQQAEQAELEALQQQELEERAAKATPSLDPAIAALPADDYVFSSTPILALAEQSVDNIFADIPVFMDNGNEIIAPDGRYLYRNDPYVLSTLEETKNIIMAEVEGNRLLEPRVSSVSGEQSWYIRSGEGFTDEDFVEIMSPQEASVLRNQWREFAIQKVQDKLAQANWQVRQEEQVVQQPVIDPALTQEERDRLLTMIETQRSNNLELVRENKELREEMLDTRKKVVNLVQRLEDSPNVNARLRATMIPESTGWKVSAVVGDRVYLMNKDKETVTLSQGDKLPSSQLTISHADENTGIVLVTPSE